MNTPCRSIVVMVYATSFAMGIASRDAGAGEAGVLPAAAVRDVDSQTLADLVAITAGAVRPDKVVKYGGDFASYWKAASPAIEGKAFEAVVANTSNSRFRALGETKRLVPTALLGRPGDAADLHLVDSASGATQRVQAKLGAQAVIDALGDATYDSMSLVTPQETFDELSEHLRKEVMAAANKGKPLAPRCQRLLEAMDSGRLWNRLPCGAPLPQREAVAAIAQAHAEGRWVAITAGAADDVTRGTAAASREVAKQSVATADEVASAADDLLRAVAGSADEAAAAASATATTTATATASATASTTLSRTAKIAQGVAKWAGPVAVVVEVGVAGYEVTTTEHQYASGQMTHEQREVAHAATAGGVGGGWAGGTSGAIGGAAVGTMVCPGVGTAVGAVVGGVGGAIGGSAAGKYVARKGTEALHGTGNTITSTARWIGGRAGDAYRWATDW